MWRSWQMERLLVIISKLYGSHNAMWNRRKKHNPTKLQIFLLMHINIQQNIAESNEICSQLGHFILRLWSASAAATPSSSSSATPPTRPSAANDGMVFFYQVFEYWVTEHTSRVLRLLVWKRRLFLHRNKIDKICTIKRSLHMHAYHVSLFFTILLIITCKQ